MTMRTAEDVFEDFAGRRQGILQALTSEVETFWRSADPERENLCLYGNPDGSWEVDLPAEEVPPEMPEPALGINFARDGMARKDWLSLVSVHSDTWLLAVAFYNGARLNREGRERLFELINSLPTVYEVVSNRVPREREAQSKPKKRGAPGAPARPALGPAPKISRPLVDVRNKVQQSHRGSSRAASARMLKPVGMPRKYRDDELDDEDEADEAPGGNDQYADGEGEPCPNCGRLYRTGDFWIACDFCDTWYDGKCVQMTAQKAERMGKWKCPACEQPHR